MYQDLQRACSATALRIKSFIRCQFMLCFFFSSEENANFEPFAHNLPILFALAHKNNVSKESSFYKVRETKWYFMC